MPIEPGTAVTATKVISDLITMGIAVILAGAFCAALCWWMAGKKKRKEESDG